jgi:putative inorganic carbon (hco3(-)) transporter
MARPGVRPYALAAPLVPFGPAAGTHRQALGSGRAQLGDGMRRLALWLSWILIFVSAWEYLYEAGTLGTMGRVVGIALAGVWALAALMSGRVRQPGLMHVLMLGFVLWCITSALWSLDPEGTQRQSITYAQLALLALIVWDLYDRPEYLERALQAFVFGAWVSAFNQIEAFLTGDEMRRVTFGQFNQNTLGFILVLALPPAWYLATNRKVTLGLPPLAATLVRLSNFLLIPVATFAIFLTASRAAVAAAVIAFGYMALGLWQLRRSARVAVFVAAAGLLVYGVTLVPESSLERLGGTTSEVSQGDWNGRLLIWGEALRLVAERPLHGVGTGAFAKGAVETGAAPHNFVLSILAELGLVGFAFFGGMLFLSGVLALRQPRPLAALWLTMLAAWLVESMAHVNEDKKITWLLFGWIAVSDLLQRATAQQRAAHGRASEAEAVARPLSAPARS